MTKGLDFVVDVDRRLPAQVEGGEPNGGSDFSIAVALRPLRRRRRHHGPPVPHPWPAPAADRGRVLVADDNA